jgi:hypothetical protein
MPSWSTIGQEPSVRWRLFARKHVNAQAKGAALMDMRKYSTTSVKPDDVRDAPRQERIVRVYEHVKFGCPVLEFESGDELLLNATNTRTLSKAYGWESDDWINHVIELVLGHYKDWNTDPPEEKETVVVRAISQPAPNAGNGGPANPKRSLDDEIPF